MGQGDLFSFMAVILRYLNSFYHAIICLTTPDCHIRFLLYIITDRKPLHDIVGTTLIIALKLLLIPRPAGGNSQLKI